MCEQTSQEIAKIERSQRDLNAEIDRLKRDLSTLKNPVDVKILSERILDKRVSAHCSYIQIWHNWTYCSL